MRLIKTHHSSLIQALQTHQLIFGTGLEAADTIEDTEAGAVIEGVVTILDDQEEGTEGVGGMVVGAEDGGGGEDGDVDEVVTITNGGQVSCDVNCRGGSF